MHRKGVLDMELQNCRNCKKLFNYITGEIICPVCRDKLEEKYNQVKAYVRENPGAHINVVSEECEVSIKQIKKWVRQERLSFSKDSGISIDCESCGRPILTGRYCKECKTKMANKFSSAYQEKAAKPEKGQSVSSNGKMRFLGN